MRAQMTYPVRRKDMILIIIHIAREDTTFFEITQIFCYFLRNFATKIQN
jgi:hypothetical protein